MRLFWWDVELRVWSDFQSRNSFFLNSEFFNNFQQKIIFRFLNEIFGFRNFIQKELNFDTDLNIAQHAKIENLSSGSEI